MGLRGQRRGHLQITRPIGAVVLQPGLGGDRGSGDIRPAGGRRRGRLLRGRRAATSTPSRCRRRHAQLGAPDWQQPSRRRRQLTAASVFVGDQARATVVALSAANGCQCSGPKAPRARQRHHIVSGRERRRCLHRVVGWESSTPSMNRTVLLMWSTSLGAASSSSPSVDPTSGVVVVADQSGTILYAFSTSKGHEQWQYRHGRTRRRLMHPR